jgi:Putative zinc finger motif, C2HC5-type
MSSNPSKTSQSQLYTTSGQSPLNSPGPTSNVPSRTSSPSKVLRIVSSKQQAGNRPKKGPGALTSDLGKQKPKPALVNPVQLAASENRPLTELEEIDSALQTLTLPSGKKKRLECGCFGTKHQVFPLAPNCLNCGRIICVNEGIGACFYCGQDLVSEDQKEEVIRELRHERGIAKTKAANEKVRKSKAGESRHRIWASKVGGQEWISRNTSGVSDANPFASGHVAPLQQDQNYLDAERRRDELLEFDRTFAERTRIIGMSSLPLHFRVCLYEANGRSTSRIYAGVDDT